MTLLISKNYLQVYIVEDMITEFTKTIKSTGNHSPKIYFYPINSAEGLRYVVKILHSDFDDYILVLVEDNEKWRIINKPKPPTWVMALEEEISEEIYRSLSMA